MDLKKLIEIILLFLLDKLEKSLSLVDQGFDFLGEIGELGHRERIVPPVECERLGQIIMGGLEFLDVGIVLLFSFDLGYDDLGSLKRAIQFHVIPLVVDIINTG